jgi:DNA-directed RNA polymerase subunit RPC12/RpoP
MECSNCGADLDLSLERCEYCGRKVPPQATQQPSATEARAEPGPTGQACPSCGHTGEPGLEKRMTSVGLLVTLGLLFACPPLFVVPLLLPQYREMSPRCSRCRAWYHPHFSGTRGPH